MEILLLFLCIVSVAFFIIWLDRNTKVYKFRTRILTEDYKNTKYLLATVFALAEDGFVDVEQIRSIDKWSFRYDSLPSYDVMMFQFWKPLSEYEKEAIPNPKTAAELLKIYHPDIKFPIPESEML